MVERAGLEGFVQNTGALCDYDLKEEVKGMKVKGLLVAGDGDGKDVTVDEACWIYEQLRYVIRFAFATFGGC